MPVFTVNKLYIQSFLKFIFRCSTNYYISYSKDKFKKALNTRSDYEYEHKCCLICFAFTSYIVRRLFDAQIFILFFHYNNLFTNVVMFACVGYSSDGDLDIDLRSLARVYMITKYLKRSTYQINKIRLKFNGVYCVSDIS